MKRNQPKVLAADLIALELERRMPENYDPGTDKSDGMLAGTLVRVTRVSGLEDEVNARAIRHLREVMNKHGCTRTKLSDPPCEKPGHWKDVGLLRHALMLTGLPGDLALLPLAYAEPRNDNGQ